MNMRFSERHGYKPVRELIQIESVDEALRNGIWSLLKIYYWDTASGGMYGYYLSSSGNEHLNTLCKRLWFDYFQKPLDTLDNDWTEVLKKLRRYFFDCRWYEMYDFIEFVANEYLHGETNTRFMVHCNKVLKKEMSAYRFVDKQIAEITEEEIRAIEEATKSNRQLVREHVQRALELLSDRTNPDYRNSIKESISAVECLATRLIEPDKGTLGQLLKKVEERIALHPALKSAFEKLYGYTSDESGIRHALMEQAKVDFDDAKFMLVACSAFVNYIECKLRETG